MELNTWSLTFESCHQTAPGRAEGGTLREVLAQDCRKGPHLEFPASLVSQTGLCITINVDQSLGPASCQGGLPGPSQGEEGPSQTGWTPGSAQDAVKTSEASQRQVRLAKSSCLCPPAVGHLSQGLVPLTPRLLPTWHRLDHRWPYASPRTWSGRGGQASRSQISPSSLAPQGRLAGVVVVSSGHVLGVCGRASMPNSALCFWSLLLVWTGLQGFQHPGHQKQDQDSCRVGRVLL